MKTFFCFSGGIRGGGIKNAQWLVCRYAPVPWHGSRLGSVDPLDLRMCPFNPRPHKVQLTSYKHPEVV